MGEFTITIDTTKAGIRLDKFLRETFPEFSRHWLQKLIKEGSIFVNGALSEPSYMLKLNDVVRISLRAPARVSLEPDPRVRFDVIYEDDSVALVNKPSGVVTHPSETTKNKTLVNGLLARWPEIEGAGEDSLRPGIVHRLDKDTSGILIVAKTQQSFEWLKFQFKNRRVIKRYRALVHGVIKDEYGVIDAPIMRSPKQATKQAIGGSKEAITFYHVLKRFKNATLVDVQPKTGRRHQIRVHFAYIGHPVVGDDKYTPKSMQKNIYSKTIRHFLHAYYIELDLPSTRHANFEAKVPESFNELMNTLRG